MYNIALCLRTDMYCDYMFLLVYSHLQVNSRHKFQPPACRLQQERKRSSLFVKIKHTFNNTIC